MPLAKAELKRDEDGEMTIEFNDTNRPDLWSAEGLARQIRVHEEGKSRPYTCFVSPKEAPAVAAGAEAVIHVSPALQDVRPYIAAFLVKGITIDDEDYASSSGPEALGELGEQACRRPVGTYVPRASRGRCAMPIPTPGARLSCRSASTSR